MPLPFNGNFIWPRSKALRVLPSQTSCSPELPAAALGFLPLLINDFQYGPCQDAETDLTCENR